MYRHKIYIAFVFLCILSLFSLSTKANPIYTDHFCGNTTFYTPNSTYEANLKTLLSSLSSNATNESGFQTNTSGDRDGDPPNVAYGVFLCRGDLTPADCQQCVAVASGRILQLCPRDRTAFIWYDECMLRFSNQSFFSTFEEGPSVSMYNTQNMTDQPRFMNLLATQMDDLATRAAVTDRSGRNFATNEANFSGFETLYSLAQCVPYLSESACNRCFRSSIGQLPLCCNGKRGARILNPNCNIRYEIYPFYRVTARAPPPTTITPSPPLPTSPRGNGRGSTQTIIAIVAPIGVSLVLFSLCCCFLVRKGRKKYYNAVTQENAVGSEIAAVQSLQYDLGSVEVATNNFSIDNKIGEGGFGEVYKILRNEDNWIGLDVTKLSEGLLVPFFTFMKILG